MDTEGVANLYSCARFAAVLLSKESTHAAHAATQALLNTRTIQAAHSSDAPVLPAL